MKTTLITMLIAALVLTARAERHCDDARDQALFQQWVNRVYALAPRYGLKMDHDETTEEFFYLYCWQSADHSVVHAIRMAKEVWSKP